MDEILIEEKKYVSSKRAAKITGYAKDYIGQLCREGRVPARFVGRSWYVLESAINDHRFGDEKSPVTTSVDAIAMKTDESPKYEAVPAQEPITAPLVKSTTQSDESTSNLQDSWKEWFNQIANQGTTARASEEQNEYSEADAREDEPTEVAEVSVPIHTAPAPEIDEYDLQEEIEVESMRETIPSQEVEERASDDRKAYIWLKICSPVAAFIFVLLAIVGSGSFDKYAVIINNGLTPVTGTAIYNK